MGGNCPSAATDNSECFTAAIPLSNHPNQPSCRKSGRWNASVVRHHGWSAEVGISAPVSQSARSRRRRRYCHHSATRTLCPACVARVLTGLKGVEVSLTSCIKPIIPSHSHPLHWGKYDRSRVRVLLYIGCQVMIYSNMRIANCSPEPNVHPKYDHDSSAGCAGGSFAVSSAGGSAASRSTTALLPTIPTRYLPTSLPPPSNPPNLDWKSSASRISLLQRQNPTVKSVRELASSSPRASAASPRGTRAPTVPCSSQTRAA
jgi:hypothetical protein